MDSLPRIAIVGLGGLFSQSPTLEHFWSHIRNGVDTAREVPPRRWLLSRQDAFHPVPGMPDKVYSTKACLIDETDPARACGVAFGDPLYSLILHAGKKAWSDGETASLDPQRVGVVTGNIV